MKRRCALPAALAIVQLCTSVYAFAVSSDSNVAAIATDGSHELKLPVSWRLTRAKFDHSGNASETENYKENWVLELDSDGRLFLRSRRARVPVVVSNQSAKGPPARMTVDKVDLALLVGLMRERAAFASDTNQMITLDLGGATLKQMKLKIDDLQNEHLSLWLKVGKPI